MSNQTQQEGQDSTATHYPCIMGKTGRTNQPVGPAMTLTEAVDLLRRDYYDAWFNCNAIPQPVTHPYFTDPTNPHYVKV
jgi:hypothetical protein